MYILMNWHWQQIPVWWRDFLSNPVHILFISCWGWGVPGTLMSGVFWSTLWGDVVSRGAGWRERIVKPNRSWQQHSKPCSCRHWLDWILNPQVQVGFCFDMSKVMFPWYFLMPQVWHDLTLVKLMDGQFHVKTAALPFDIDSLRVRTGHIPSQFLPYLTPCRRKCSQWPEGRRNVGSCLVAPPYWWPVELPGDLDLIGPSLNPASWAMIAYCRCRHILCWQRMLMNRQRYPFKSYCRL